jgi:hypothetical protein
MPTCVFALTYPRLIENRLHHAGLSISASSTMEQMRKLHSCLYWTDPSENPDRIIEESTRSHAQILRVLGYGDNNRNLRISLYAR